MDKYRIVDDNNNTLADIEFNENIYGEEAFCLLKEINDAVKGAGWYQIEAEG